MDVPDHRLLALLRDRPGAPRWQRAALRRLIRARRRVDRAETRAR